MEAATTSRSQDVLPQLEVSDFGPIEHATINLRPLSVFIGPSNTGKSYLAVLLYALHRYFGDSRRHWFPRVQSIFDHAETSALADDPVAAITELISKLFEHGKNREDLLLPESVADILTTVFRNAIGSDLGNEISRCFGFGYAALRQMNGARSPRLTIRAQPTGVHGAIEHVVDLGLDNVEVESKIREGMPMTLSGNLANDLVRRWPFWTMSGADEQRARVFAPHFLGLLAAKLQPSIYTHFGHPAYYLPADRTGIMHAHRVVVSAVLGNASMAGIRPASQMPMMSGILADFLKTLINLDEPAGFDARRSRPKEILYVCEAIEARILKGSVLMESSDVIKYPQFAYKPNGWKKSLPLKNASSMVSELAPVVLYLRHQVERDEALIIEEPESHLHPAMQVEFTRQIAALVNAGVQVIITTHSEWVLEELANIVRKSSVSQSARREIGGGSVALRRRQVGAWLFSLSGESGGSQVTQIDLDDSGLYPSGFDDVAAALHNDWAQISRKIGQ